MSNTKKVGLKNASTIALVNELASRNGIEKIFVEPERPYEYRKPYESQRTVLTNGCILLVPYESYFEAK